MPIKTLEVSACSELKSLTLPHVNSVDNKSTATFSKLSGCKLIDPNTNSDKGGKVLRTIKHNEISLIRFNGGRWVEKKIIYLKK